MITIDLAGKNAVVTGAGRGIGRAIAECLARAGAGVLVNDIDASGEETALELRAAGLRADFFQGSVADQSATDAMMKKAAEQFGSIDILVNNAGLTRDAVVHRLDELSWDQVIDVNLKGTFNCIRSAAPYMRDVAKAEIEKYGAPRHHRKIVNFCSTAALRGNPGQINYTAAKMGNLGITYTMAREWGAFWINVNAVAPGFTETRLTAEKSPGDALGIPKVQREQMIASIPFGRAVLPAEVADAVLFFVSPLSDMVTGQVINVSGGMQIP